MNTEYDPAKMACRGGEVLSLGLRTVKCLACRKEVPRKERDHWLFGFKACKERAQGDAPKPQGDGP